MYRKTNKETSSDSSSFFFTGLQFFNPTSLLSRLHRTILVIGSMVCKCVLNFSKKPLILVEASSLLQSKFDFLSIIIKKNQFIPNHKEILGSFDPTRDCYLPPGGCLLRSVVFLAHRLHGNPIGVVVVRLGVGCRGRIVGAGVIRNGLSHRG